MTEKNFTAYPGYYVNMENVLPVLKQLLADADARRSKIVLVGGGENAKLDGAVMSILAIKEMLFHLEVHGDLIPTPDPLKEVAHAAAFKAVQSQKDAPTIIGGDAPITPKEISPIIQ